MKKEHYLVKGMSCAACQAHVDKAVKTTDGVISCNVNLLTNSMDVEYDEKVTDSNKIITSVRNAGYDAKVHNENLSSEELKDNETPRLLRRLIISFILLIPLFYLCMGYMLNWPIGLFRDNPLILAIIEMVLSLAIMIINHKFFISGTKAIFHKSMNMDTLVMLGSGVAFIYSFVMTIILIIKVINKEDMASLHMTMMNMSYETAGMVPTLITIGKLLESYSKGKTTSAIKALLDISPKTANVIREEKEINVPVNEVVIDDIFIVRPGEIIPVDGIVINGESSVDESMLTGESMPIDKVIGSELKSGTINKNGVITAKATKVGEDTTINQIIKLVGKAANSKAKISQIADKVSGIFVPVVIIISLLVFAGWMIFGKGFIESHTDIESSRLSYSIERAIAVLVISCPCALGLATPVAIMVGSGKGAKHGILFKNAVVIEETGKIDYLILDKTGTITKGEPTVTEIISEVENKEILTIACSLENNSEHPLAQAILKKGREEGIELLDVNNFLSISGKGIKGQINGDNYLLGNKKFMIENHIDISLIEEELNRLSLEGKTPMILAKNDMYLALIMVSDVIKDDSKEAIQKIKNLGIIPIMLTGDNELTARYIANQVGIDCVISDVYPEGKYQIIELFKKHGKVMMVGDGINDAVALTSANVGMAIGQGSDVAIESADVVLMKSTLMDAYAAIRLSQYTYLNIKENLFWAFIYNIIMIPIAAGAFSMLGLYKVAPWMGSAAMAMSSVFVVLNALRINLFRPYKNHKRNRKVYDISTILEERNENMTVVIKVKGMMCMHCVAHVKSALEKVDGVTSVDVSLDEGEARVTLSKEVDEEVLKAAIREAGYEA